MAKKIKLGTVLPPDTFFYTIPFGQPGQRLTRELLAKHNPVPTGRLAHMGIHTEYKAFKNGMVWVEVKAPDNSENMLFLHVGLTELDVACTCGCLMVSFVTMPIWVYIVLLGLVIWNWTGFIGPDLRQMITLRISF